MEELQDGRIKSENPTYAKREVIELMLLYDILEDEAPEEYWKQIEEQEEFLCV